MRAPTNGVIIVIHFVKNVKYALNIELQTTLYQI